MFASYLLYLLLMTSTTTQGRPGLVLGLFRRCTSWIAKRLANTREIVSACV
jgi:hypothetical protein